MKLVFLSAAHCTATQRSRFPVKIDGAVIYLTDRIYRLLFMLAAEAKYKSNSENPGWVEGKRISLLARESLYRLRRQLIDKRVNLIIDVSAQGLYKLDLPPKEISISQTNMRTLNIGSDLMLYLSHTQKHRKRAKR